MAKGMELGQGNRRLKLYEMADKRAQEKHEIETDPERLELQMKAAIQSMSTAQLDHQLKVLKVMQHWVPNIRNVDDYAEVLPEFEKMGANTKMLPSPADLDTPEKLEQWKQQAMLAGKGMAELVKYQLDLKKLLDYESPEEKRKAETEEKKKLAEHKAKNQTDSYDKNLLVAAQAAGVDPEKVKKGGLTQEEAVAVAEAYSEQFGTKSLLQMLFSGMAPEQPALKFDDKGNPVE
jgi:hypothetical protein